MTHSHIFLCGQKEDQPNRGAWLKSKKPSESVGLISQVLPHQQTWTFWKTRLLSFQSAQTPNQNRKVSQKSPASNFAPRRGPILHLCRAHGAATQGGTAFSRLPAAQGDSRRHNSLCGCLSRQLNNLIARSTLWAQGKSRAYLDPFGLFQSNPQDPYGVPLRLTDYELGILPFIPMHPVVLFLLQMVPDKSHDYRMKG